MCFLVRVPGVLDDSLVMTWVSAMCVFPKMGGCPKDLCLHLKAGLSWTPDASWFGMYSWSMGDHEVLELERVTGTRLVFSLCSWKPQFKHYFKKWMKLGNQLCAPLPMWRAARASLHWSSFLFRIISHLMGQYASVTCICSDWKWLGLCFFFFFKIIFSFWVS